MRLLDLQANPGPEEVVVLVGAGLGHEVHPCPHCVSGGREAVPSEHRGWSWSLSKITSMILASSSMGKVARTLLPSATGTEDGVLGSRRAQGRDPGSNHVEPRLGVPDGPQPGLAEPWPRRPCREGSRASARRAGLVLHLCVHLLAPASPLTAVHTAHWGGWEEGQHPWEELPSQCNRGDMSPSHAQS